MFPWPGALWSPLNRPHYLPSLLALILPQPLPGHASKLPFCEHFCSSPCLQRDNGNSWWIRKALHSQTTNRFSITTLSPFSNSQNSPGSPLTLECAILSQLHAFMIQAILSATSLPLVQISPPL